MNDSMLDRMLIQQHIQIQYLRRNINHNLIKRDQQWNELFIKEVRMIIDILHPVHAPTDMGIEPQVQGRRADKFD